MQESVGAREFMKNLFFMHDLSESEERFEGLYSKRGESCDGRSPEKDPTSVEPDLRRREKTQFHSKLRSGSRAAETLELTRGSPER